MSETIEQAVKAVEERLEAAVKQHAGQVEENVKAAQAARDEVKRLAEEYKSLIEEKEGLSERIKGLEQQAADGFQGAGRERQKDWGETFVESESFKAAKPTVPPTFDGVDYDDNKQLKAAQDSIIREQWVQSMMARLIREEMGKCYYKEGVNHLEKCGHLRGMS